MSEKHSGKHHKQPKRATDRRRTYSATLGGTQIEDGSGDGSGDGNGMARALGIFKDRRTSIGTGKRAS